MNGKRSAAVRFELYHVGISVADLDAMTAWYANTLGFTVEGAFEVEQKGLRGRLLSHACGLGLELLERAGSKVVGNYSDPFAAALIRGYGHIALRVSDLDACFEHLISAGARAVWSPRPAPIPGSRMAYVSDPEGNLIELVT
ncbi:VOC family protein [Rubrobacter calidifluminis]|uniref:VOC family protein n=1 Tax=Rubrobacter calidifluminis TaxID=1392640 RepID=UPI0023629263|nr:VOC family protein [Rubrobacter calidifluminis]